MPDNHSNIVNSPIRCISCTKIIAQGSMSLGKIIIRCKCGVENVIEARNKPEGRVKVIVNTDHAARGFIQCNQM